jgi:hypothetical protein
VTHTWARIASALRMKGTMRWRHISGMADVARNKSVTFQRVLQIQARKR